MDDYTPRLVDGILDELMPHLAAIVIEGPKGVGKTATAERRATTTIHLDDPADVALVRADPAILARSSPPVLVDEWQRVPELWDRVRRLVDDGAAPGSFLLTGSAMPVDAPVHSGAGRIDTLRMRPMSLAERYPDQPPLPVAERAGAEVLSLPLSPAHSLQDIQEAIDALRRVHASFSA